MIEISVIVPIYNAEKFLSVCVDSVLSQSFTDFELILVNDGSMDTTGKICDDYAEKDSRIKVFHKENGGVSAARNFGIKQASGNYVTFIDADDFISPSFLSDFNTKSVEADFYVQGYIEWTAQQTYREVPIIKDNKYFNFCARIIETLDIEHSVLEAPWGKLFKKELLLANNQFFNEGLSNAEDHLFVMEYLKYINSMYVCSSVNYYYRKFDNENALSNKFISHDKLHLYAVSVYNARLYNIHTHSMSERYKNFTVNVHSDLISKSLIKLFNKQSALSSAEIKKFITKYLSEIEELAKNNELRTVKTNVLIRGVWKSWLPCKLKILEKILSK